MAKHKVVTEKIAQHAEVAKTQAQKKKLKAYEAAHAAAIEDRDAQKAAEDTRVAHSEAHDVSNLKTGIAFRALEDKIKLDEVATHRTLAAKNLGSHTAAVSGAVAEKEEEATEAASEASAEDAPAEAPVEA